jgi:hypothetical protein
VRRYSMNMDSEAVAASQTAQILGATGTITDILERVIIVPTTLSPGSVTIINGDGGTSTVIFNGGASSLTELKPIVVELGVVCNAAGGWRITTGANVACLCVGRFR